jgi:amino acid transporter
MKNKFFKLMVTIVTIAYISLVLGVLVSSGMPWYIYTPVIIIIAILTVFFLKTFTEGTKNENKKQ